LILGLLGASRKGDLALVVRQFFAPFGEQDLKAVPIFVHGHEDGSSPETGVVNNLSPPFREGSADLLLCQKAHTSSAGPINIA
jgi:hypothetical protein